MRLRVAGDTLEAAAVLDEILTNESPGVLSDEYFSRDHGPLWKLLVAGEWTELGAELALLDLAELVRVWARHLVPLPFVPTLLLRRWGAGTAGEPVSYALAPDVVPFAGAPTTVVADLATGAELPATPAERPWAPSMPLGGAHGITAGLDETRRAELLVLAQAEMIGCADRLLRETTDYARQRIQFGRPIAEYQAVRHRLADMLRDVEMSRTALVWAANSPADAARAATVTLGWCESVADGAIQLHGGYGFTWEAGLHFVRRHLSCLGEVLAAAGAHRWPA
jgi:hypothetical protein